jgi:hypothetical protein
VVWYARDEEEESRCLLCSGGLPQAAGLARACALFGTVAINIEV